jgi:hypothetical protein
MSSMPQQAVANGIGHRLFDRAQLAAASSRVMKTLSGSPAFVPRSTMTDSCRSGIRENSGVCLLKFSATVSRMLRRRYRHLKTPFFQA